VAQNAYITLSLCLVLLLSATPESSAQYEPGQVYHDDSLWVEYQAGNLPIILISSHGGYLEPSSLPDRDCEGCVYLRDAYTQEITRMAAEEIHRLTGCYPHVIYNLLHRRKLDANRAIIEATDSTALAEPPWYSFHGFIDSASAAVEQAWSKGIVIDVHGHAHDLQRLEMGTLLSDADLMLSDQEINSGPLIAKSSCNHLIHNNISGADHVELLRGLTALGSLLDTCGWSAIPSADIPLLGAGEPHFNGGYITKRHGSRDSGTVDAIQIEGNNEMRWDATQRALFADILAKKLLEYVSIHYIEDFGYGYCGIHPDLESSIHTDTQCLEIKAHQDNEWFVIDGVLEDYEISIYDSDNQLYRVYQNVQARLAINKAKLPIGRYYVHIKNTVNNQIWVELLLKEN